jgi:hypothetical protein
MATERTPRFNYSSLLQAVDLGDMSIDQRLLTRQLEASSSFVSDPNDEEEAEHLWPDASFPAARDIGVVTSGLFFGAG